MCCEMSAFGKDVYLLSHIRDNVPASTPKRNLLHGENLPLLDDIALLLSTKAKGDTCAVMLRLTYQRVDIIFSKNAPTRKSLDAYLSEIRRIIASPMSSEDKVKELYPLVVITCFEKIRSRMQKIQQILLAYPQPLNFPSDSKDLSTIRKKWNNMNDGQIATEYLTNLQETDLDMEKFKIGLPALANSCQAAFSIGSVAR